MEEFFSIFARMIVGSILKKCFRLSCHMQVPKLYNLNLNIGGSFGTKDSVASLVMQQTSAIQYLMFIAISITGTIYVANSVGEQHPSKAKSYGLVGFYVIYG